MEKEIEKFLKREIIGKKIIFYDEINSTQTEAKKLADNGSENGTMVLADYQIDGIGTHGRKWYSKKGDNISFTLILYPKCSIKKLENITIDIAECMTNAIYEVCSKKLDIKKPNDIVYNKKKIGGILTQIITIR